MSTSIFGFIQVKDEYSHTWENAMNIGTVPLWIQNYDVYAFLFNVRNGTHGTYKHPLFANRGYPKDFDEKIKENNFDLQVFGESYITYKELKEEWNKIIPYSIDNYESVKFGITYYLKLMEACVFRWKPDNVRMVVWFS